MGNYKSIDEIQPGVVLSDPVFNRYGQIVVAAGTVIDEKHLEKLKTWGITHMAIEIDEDKETDPRLLEMAKERVEKRLSWSPRNPIEKDLYNAAVMRAVHIIKERQEI